MDEGVRDAAERGDSFRLVAGLLVLLVDDEPLVRRSFARALRRASMRVVECGTAAEALRVLRDDPSIGLILSDVSLPDSACVYCGNCIGVCPTGALAFRTEHDMRLAGTWDEDIQEVTTTVCSFCGVGCNLELHTQDDRIVKVTSPSDHSVTHGHLCIKGRFGWQQHAHS